MGLLPARVCGCHKDTLNETNLASSRADDWLDLRANSRPRQRVMGRSNVKSTLSGSTMDEPSRLDTFPWLYVCSKARPRLDSTADF